MSDSIRDARFRMADESGRSSPAAMNAGREMSLRRFADRHSAITGRVCGALTKDFRAAVRVACIVKTQWLAGRIAPSPDGLAADGAPVLCRRTSDRDPATANPAIVSFRPRFY